MPRLIIVFLLFFICNSLFAGKGPKEKIIEIKTEYGTIYIWLYKDTPLHRDNFLKLAGENFFDSTM
ncbi:MAG: peptidylprolyl isomerase, partial [Bacteroidota bacterium]